MRAKKICFSVLILSLIFLTGGASLFKSKKEKIETTKKEKVSKNKAGKTEAQNTQFYALIVTPTGELSSRVQHPSVQVVFSEPVVPLKKLGEPFSECEWVSIEPKLNGVFRWYGTSTLSFDCADALIPQKIYTVKINPNTVSINGNKFSGQSEFSFYTEEIRLVNLIPGYSLQKEKKIYFNSNDIAPEYAKDVALVFSNKVNAAVISKYISVKSEKTECGFAAEQIDEKTVLLKFKEQFQRDKEITVTLAKGAEPDEGCRKTESEQKRSFHTLRPLKVENIDGSNDLRISFNHQIAPELQKEIFNALTFKPQMEIKPEQIIVEGNTICINDLPVTFSDTYSFAIAPNTVRDVYGQIYEKEISKKIKVPDADVFANVKVNGFAFLESGFAPKLAYESQNIGDFGSYYKITPIAGVTDSFTLPSVKTVSIKTDAKDKNRRAIKTIDLRPFLEKTASGEYRGVIKFENSFFYDASSKKYNTPRVSYVQVTDLGITTRVSSNKLIVNVSSLKNATPISNAEVSLYQIERNAKYNQEGILLAKGKKIATKKTDADGIAIFENELSSNNNYALVCSTADDRAVLEINKVYSNERQITQIFTQSDVFRPKDTVQIKVIDRDLKDGKYSTYTGGYTLRIVDKQYRWAKDKKVFAEFTGNVTDQGTASAKWTVPEDAVPGAYYVEYIRGNSKTNSNPKEENPQYAQFSVQYFERLRFSASATITPITYTRGDLVTASVDANYLGGGTLSGGTARAEWNRYETHFYGSGDYAEYTFGPGSFQIWKYYDEEADVEEDDFFETEETNLSDDGNARFSVKTGTEKKDGAPYNYSLQALVTDSGNQMIAARDSVVVHPAAYYIGIKQSGAKGNAWRGFPKAGEPIQFDYITLTPDLQKVANTLYAKENFSWKLEHKVWKNNFVVDEYGFQRSRWVEELELQESGVFKNREGALALTPKEGGNYILTISGADSNGRKVITEYSFYVTSSEWNSIKDGGHQIELIADKEKYEVGETANIVLNSTLPNGSYLVTICAEGVLDYQVLHLNENSSVIEIPIKENYLPHISVQVSSYSGRTGEPAKDYDTQDQNKPQNILASIDLEVSTKTKTFDVKITPSQKSYRPGNIVQIELEATKDGAALEGAELALIVVDKGVLGLTNYKINSPLNFFYERWRFDTNVYNRDSRGWLLDPVAYGDYTLPARVREIVMYTYNNKMYKSMAMDDAIECVAEEEYDMAAPMMASRATAAGAAKESDEGGTAVQIRKDFNMTAAFIPCLKTGKDGKVNAVFTLPDTLTEYDITVIGVKDDNFAKANESLKVANPISARDVQTKILRLGDLGEAGVVITNIGDRDEKVQITFDVESGLSKTSYKREEGDLLRRDGKASVQGEQTKTVTVEAGKTKSVMFNLRAQDYGWVTLSFKVNCSEVNEIIYKPLEIQKPYVYETVTTLGVIADNKKSALEKIEFPSLTEDGKGSLYLQIDSTRLGTLRSAVDYVFHYPYGCMEQRSSATLPLVAFGEYIDIFGLNSEVEKPASVVQKELAEWAKVQRNDGGFPYWKGDKESSFGVSLQIAEVIALAREKGIFVPPALDVDKLASYIKKEYAQYKKDGIGEYLQAYCLYVIARLKAGANVKDINSILQNKNASISSMAFAALAAEETGNKKLAQETVAKIKKMMSLTTRGVTFQNKDYGCYYFFGGKIEQYALCLQLFSKVDATDLYVVRLIYELLEFQKAYQGTWHTTAATTRALIAINTYIKAAGLEKSDLSAQVLLGGKKVLEGSFKGVGAEPVDVTFDFASPEISSLKKDTEIPLEVKKSGTGALYYTASMQYALPAAEQVARDEGLCVYAEITDARTGEKVDPSNLKSGTIYRQKVFVTSTKDRTFVALRAAVPAGTEILNAAFVTTASVPNKNAEKQEPRGWGDWWQSRMSHQDIYDAEIRCFWNYLAAGTQSFEFLFRANRTGVYQTPAVLAECMYEPEIFGRSNGYEATIKD